MAKKKRYKTVRVPETTNNIQRGIVAFLNQRGHRAFRVNGAAVFDPVSMAYRNKAKEDKGPPDVLACMRPYGRYTGFEVKFDGDTMSDDQIAFKADVLAAGGEFIEVETWQGFLNWYATSQYSKY